MNTIQDLNTLTMLVDSVAESLRDITRLKDEHRKKVIRVAFADIERAKLFWRNGRVDGLDNALARLVNARAALAESLKSSVNPVRRGHMVAEVLKTIIVALNDIKKALAECQEEEVAHAC